jgi:hypothetical protein
MAAKLAGPFEQRVNESSLAFDTVYDCFSSRTATASLNPSEKARANREMLRRALEAEGYRNHPRPWGYWATFGWATLVSVLSMMIVVVVTLLWRPDILSKPVDLLNDGALLFLLTTGRSKIPLTLITVSTAIPHFGR